MRDRRGVRPQADRRAPDPRRDRACPRPRRRGVAAGDPRATGRPAAHPSGGERAMLRLDPRRPLAGAAHQLARGGLHRRLLWQDERLIVEVDGYDVPLRPPRVRARPSPGHRPQERRLRGAPVHRAPARRGAVARDHHHRPRARPSDPRLGSAHDARPPHERRRDRGRRAPGAEIGPAASRRDRARGDRARREPLGDGEVDHHPAAAVGSGGRLRGRDRPDTPPTAPRSTASGWPTSGWSRGSRRSWSCPASTTARTSGTTSPTRGRWRRRSRRSCSGFPAIAVSQQSSARELDFRVGTGFDFTVAASFTANLVAELEQHAVAARRPC